MASFRWWTKDTLAVVTGGNKGIGFEVAKQLTEKGLTVVLTARDEGKGLAAVGKLKAAGLTVAFHPLDVQSTESVFKFSLWIKQQYGGLDILVNNAAIASSELTYESAKLILDTNYDGVKRVTQALLPLMKSSAAAARIVNVTSVLGQLQYVKSDSLKQEMADVKRLKEEMIDDFVQRYLQAVKANKVDEEGWPTGMYSAYCVSKLAMNAYSRMIALSLEKRPEGDKIYVNCIHPGLVQTDMSGHTGNMTPEEGADGVVWLSLLPPPTGIFFNEKSPCEY